MELDSYFCLFLEALIQNAMKHPDQLKTLEEVWDKEWSELLDGIDDGDESSLILIESGIGIRRTSKWRSTSAKIRN